MFEVSQLAATELDKVLTSDMAKDKSLVIYFQGYGWGGPTLGMALEESIDGMEKLESNGIVAYIESGLLTLVKKLGKISIDYRQVPGGGGYVVTIGEGGCGNCSC